MQNNITIAYKNIKLNISLLGAEVKSFKVNDKEIIHQEDIYWKGSATHLFPIVGKLYKNKTLIDNKEYQMTGHGIIRHSIFNIVDVKKNQVILKKDFDNNTLINYPYKFSYIIKYTIKPNKLITDIQIINKDDKTIYFNIGEHPGLNLEHNFTDYKICFNKKENFDRYFVNEDKLFDFNNILNTYKDLKELKLNYDLFDNDAIFIKHVNSNKVSIRYKNKEIYIFKFNNFKSFALWSVRDASFICLEPWNGYADIAGKKEYNFLEKHDLIILKKCKTKKFKTELLLI